ncbi:MAG: NAD-dependent epimerase/dehydratase family protein, partial [Candidatus Omnitrophota bacterium]
MKYFVTGCAGFIGSSLTDRLLKLGQRVVGYDNFSTGQMPFLEKALKSPAFKLIRGDTLDLVGLMEAMRGTDFVFHLAANADVRFGVEHPRKDGARTFDHRLGRRHLWVEIRFQRAADQRGRLRRARRHHVRHAGHGTHHHGPGNRRRDPRMPFPLQPLEQHAGAETHAEDDRRLMPRGQIADEVV